MAAHATKKNFVVSLFGFNYKGINGARSLDSERKNKTRFYVTLSKYEFTFVVFCPKFL
jgi:hypothetical protein